MACWSRHNHYFAIASFLFISISIVQSLLRFFPFFKPILHQHLYPIQSLRHHQVTSRPIRIFWCNGYGPLSWSNTDPFVTVPCLRLVPKQTSTQPWPWLKFQGWIPCANRRRLTTLAPCLILRGRNVGPLTNPISQARLKPLAATPSTNTMSRISFSTTDILLPQPT